MLRARCALVGKLPPRLPQRWDLAWDMCVVGLLVVSPRTLYGGPLTRFTPEEDLLHKYWGTGEDAYTVTVERSAALAEPCQLSYGDGTYRGRAKRFLFPLPAGSIEAILARDDFVVDRQAGVFLTGWDVLRRWSWPPAGPGQVMCLTLPAHVAKCAAHGVWPQLLMLGRWPCVAKIFDGWPPLCYFNRHARNILLQPLNDDDDTQHGINEAIDRIQQWAPTLLAHARHAAAFGLELSAAQDMQSELEATVVYLRRVAAVFNPNAATELEADSASHAYPMAALITHLRHANLLKFTGALRQSIEHSVATAVPLAMQMPARAALNQRLAVPSQETVRVWKFMFDAAFSKWFATKDVAALGRDTDAMPLFYVWSDSSPQGKRNWQITQLHYVSPHELQALAFAVDSLAQGAAHKDFDDDCSSSRANSVALAETSSSEGSAQDEPDLTDLEEDLGGIVSEKAPQGSAGADRKRHTRTVFRALRWHVPPPSGLGAARESLQHKLGAVLHSLRMSCDSDAKLQDMANHTFSVTTDMGTELGLSDAVGCAELWSYFTPALPGMPGGPAAEVLEPDEGTVQELAPAAVARQLQDHVFPMSIPIPGLCHILDNATHDLLDSLPGWGDYLPHLQTMTDLLCQPWSRERFDATCTKGRGLNHFEGMFDRSFKPIVGWRWGTLCDTLSWLTVLRIPLQAAWDSQAFNFGWELGEGYGGNQRAPGRREWERTPLDADAVTRAVTSSWFGSTRRCGCACRV